MSIGLSWGSVGPYFIFLNNMHVSEKDMVADLDNYILDYNKLVNIFQKCSLDLGHFKLMTVDLCPCDTLL